MYRGMMIGGLAAELLAGLLLWASSGEWASERSAWLRQGLIVTAVGLHTVSSYYLARAFWLLLPRRYKLPPRRSLGLLLVILWILPVLGALGVLWSIITALKRPRTRFSRDIRLVVLPELPFSPPTVFPVLPYSEGALRQIIRFAERPLKRVKAVMATRQIAPREAMAIWSRATRDPVDDVRLLAYAMRDDNEKKLTDRILGLTEALPDLPVRAQNISRQTIAALCWELVYHRLVHGAVREHWLRTARHHLESVLLAPTAPAVPAAPDVPATSAPAERTHAAVADPLSDSRMAGWPSVTSAPDGEGWLLYGRILLEADEPAGARDAFANARSGGIDERKLLPWLAEAAFRERRFSEVKRHLAAAAMHGERGRTLALVSAWWNR